MVNLVQNQIGNENAEEGYISLEFRHNAYDDSPDRLGVGFVSFKIENLTLNAEKGLKIRVNTIYNGVKYYKIDFPTSTTNLKVVRQPETSNLFNEKIY